MGFAFGIVPDMEYRLSSRSSLIEWSRIKLLKEVSRKLISFMEYVEKNTLVY